MHKYDWVATMTTPQDFPAFIVDANLTLADNQQLGLFASQSSIRGKWPQSPYIDQVGQRNKYLPTSADITWLSYAEDQLYKTHCPFDIGKVQALFDNGFSEPWWGGDTTFSKVTIGVAPGGNVSTWLQGGKATILIGACKGDKFDLPYKKWSDIPSITREEFIKLEASNYDESDGVHPFGTPVDTQRWDDYLKRYSWQPTLIRAPEDSFFGMRVYSGESYLFGVQKSPGQHRDTHGVPKLFLIYMERDGYRHTARAILNKEEAFKAFNKFLELAEGEPLRLEIEVSDNLKGVALWLKTGKHVYLFSKTTVTSSKMRPPN